MCSGDSKVVDVLGQKLRARKVMGHHTAQGLHGPRKEWVRHHLEDFKQRNDMI